MRRTNNRVPIHEASRGLIGMIPTSTFERWFGNTSDPTITTAEINARLSAATGQCVHWTTAFGGSALGGQRRVIYVHLGARRGRDA